MEQPRGRSPSQGNRQHISPIPSPHFQDSIHGVDPSVQQALTSGKFTTAQQYQPSFPSSQSHNPDTQFYSDSFDQNVFQDNQYQSLNPAYTATNDFMYQNPTMLNDWPQNYAMEQSYMNQQSNVNPADLSKVSSPHDHQSPNLLSAENHSSPGPQPGSPGSTNGQFYTPQHSRHTSLDPSSAYGESFSGAPFQQHRRAPSDHSDVSSTTHSPYLGQQELHDSIENNHSPFLTAQQDTNNTFGIDNFSLGDQPYRSPRLMPEMEGHQSHGLGLHQTQADIMLNQGMGMPNPEIYTTQADQYPGMHSDHMRNASVASEIGQADQFAPPTINIEPAPVSRQTSFGPLGDQHLEGALSPPTGSRGRSRSKSDLTGLVRPMGVGRSVSPSRPEALDPTDSLSIRSYSPGPSMSRETSPAPGTRVDKNRRASTSSITNRDYILDLADPSRPNASPSGTSTRVQKHPATFQCTLCPKRFTRAYNLRSHLRTHTDERPFVCTVCGKAFARQHDRKRHEGLHSGEKKFVCRGELHSQQGQHWGCGRRFARADALGRHFRSEAGRVCIKPLLDEEALERQNKAMMEQQQQQMQYAQGNLQPVPQPLMIGMDPTTGTGGFALPAALLAQYPALQNIDWSQVPSADDPGELSDVGMGRQSFDGSSGGEYYDDDVSEGYISGSGMNPPYHGQQMYMGN